MGKPLRVKERKGEGKHPTAAADIFVNSEIQFAEGKHFHSSEECNFRLGHSGMFGPLCLLPSTYYYCTMGKSSFKNGKRYIVMYDSDNALKALSSALYNPHYQSIINIIQNEILNLSCEQRFMH